jgi:predicted PurR-regulated permease PerM
MPLPPAAPRSNPVAPPEIPSQSSLMTLLVAVVVVAGMYVGRDVALPLVLAVLLGFVLAPVVDFLRRLRLGRVPAVIIAVLLALSVIVGLATAIGMQVAQLAAELPRYEQTVRDKFSRLHGATVGRASEVVRDVGRRIEQAAEDAAPPEARAAEAERRAQRPMAVEVHEPDPTPLQTARNILAPLLSPLATAAIVFVVVIFILMQREDLRDRMIRLFGARDLHRTTVAMDDAARRLSRFFLLQVTMSAAYGVAIGAALWLIGIPSPILGGILAALMRFVPYIGSFIAAGLPLVLATAVDPGWSMVLWTLALYLVAEPVMGNVVEPLVYGKGIGLAPFAIVVSAVFWTWLWGPVGLLIATPLTLCLVVLGRHVERLEFLDVLLGDRPALTPAESFYQRMLAGDPDEAQEHAEQLLKERSISSYYDEVVLKGLQLAANDLERGVLTSEQVHRIDESVRSLAADLADHPDVDPASKDQGEGPVAPPPAERDLPKDPPVAVQAPPPDELPPIWRGDTPVMCIAGRGPLDEAASTLLGQLLRKHGLGARVVPHEAVSRSNILELDVDEVAMVCISYLEISGNPAHLRYLLRRLRQKLPDAPLLVGLWPAEEAVLKDEKLRAALGADHSVTSLREAVAACLGEAGRARASAAPEAVAAE